MNLRNFVWILVVCLVITIIGLGVRTLAAEPPTVPLDKIDMYHLQAVVAQQNLAQQQLNNLYIQFINANPDAKALRAKLDGLSAEQDALVSLLFTQAKLDKAKYQIDLEKGEFKKIEVKK